MVAPGVITSSSSHTSAPVPFINLKVEMRIKVVKLGQKEQCHCTTGCESLSPPSDTAAAAMVGPAFIWDIQVGQDPAMFSWRPQRILDFPILKETLQLPKLCWIRCPLLRAKPPVFLSHFSYQQQMYLSELIFVLFLPLSHSIETCCHQASSHFPGLMMSAWK